MCDGEEEVVEVGTTVGLGWVSPSVIFENCVKGMELSVLYKAEGVAQGG